MNPLLAGILASIAAVTLTLTVLPDAKEAITQARQVCHTDTECEALYPAIAAELNNQAY